MSRSLLALILITALCAPTSAHAAVVTFLTSGTSYSTPVDWNNSDNSIECIGAGGNGGTNNFGGGGGGGGAYAKITNLTIAGSIAYSIASGGSQADTTFNSTSLVCDAGNNGSGTTGGTGGTTGASTGTTKFNGGSGENSGGGGGAGGTTNDGTDGLGGNGGDGGSTSGGAGGLSGGSFGSDGTVWQVSPARGAGGGGGLGTPGEVEVGCVIDGGPGGNGGSFGGGAGGGGPRTGAACLPGSGGTGAQGIITVTYTPASVPASSVSSGLKILPFGSLKITGGGIKIK